MEQTKFFSKMEKCEARNMIESAEVEGIQFFQFEENGVTVAVKRTGPEMIAFAIAIASPDESKFRKLIGKVKALERFDSCPMPAVCPVYMIPEFAARMAELVG